MNPRLFSYFLFTLILLTVHTTVTQPLFQVTNKYIETGTFTFATNPCPYYNNATLLSWNGQLFNIPYQTFTSSSYQPMCALQQVDYQFANNYLNISLATSTRYTNALKVVLYSTTLNLLKNVRIRYIVLDNKVMKISIYSLRYYIQGGSPQLLNSTNPILIQYTGFPSITMATGTIRNFLIINGINATAPSGIFDIKATAQRISSSDLDVTLSTKYIQNTQIYAVKMSLISYNQDQISIWPFPAVRLNYQDFTSPSSASGYYTLVPSLIQTYNTFWGINHFSYSGQLTLAWTSDFTVGTNIHGESRYPHDGQQWTGLVFQFKQCDTTTPYYILAFDLCYNPCPPRYYTDNTDYICGLCPISSYDCYTCNSAGTCLTCNATLDFRVLSSGRCIPLDGYYDDGTQSSTALPCDLTLCATCNTTSSQCYTCNSGYYLTGTTCSPCITLCSVCTNANNCQTCMSGYTITSPNVCGIDCSAISYWSTCDSTNGVTICRTGYLMSSNVLCSPICGNGLLQATQQCDDGNIANGDGCSSLCIIESAHYCNTVLQPTPCGPCVSNCLNCTTATDCPVCMSGAIFSSALFICAYDCSNISLCQNCYPNISNPSTVSCTQCSNGYAPNALKTSCDPICGDGILLGTEGCDDGNVLNGDGCSSACIVQNTYYCAATGGTPGSACSHCLQFCTLCSIATDCSSCISPATFDGTVCLVPCPAVTTCSTCTFSSSLAVVCSSCITGYSIVSQQCLPICGDGQILGSQSCDDNNMLSGDGCSSQCVVEQYFVCNGTTGSGASICYLIELTMQKISFQKDPTSNTLILTYKPVPGNLPLFNNIDWSTILVPPSSDTTIQSYNYDATTGQLTINLAYTNDLTSAPTIDFTINSGTLTSLQYVNNKVVSTPLQTDDNQALVAYPEDVYGMAKMIKYLSMVAGILALIMVIMALFGGKLIGLEAAAVIQLTYLSLITTDNMSPTFMNLNGLGLSCGYNKIRPYDFSEGVDRPFKGIQFDINFGVNYNIMAIMIVLPILICLISKLLSKTLLKNRQNLLTMIQQFSLFEFTFYGFLFNAYIIVVSLAVDAIYFSKSNNSGLQAIGLILGLGFLAMGVVYFVLFQKSNKYFGQFKNKFIVDPFSQKFYLIFIIERFITSAILATMISLQFQNIFLIVIFTAILVIIAKKQPYSGKRSCWRPIGNMAITIAIQLIYLLNNLFNDPKSPITLYGPLLIILGIYLCLIYSIYYLVLQLKEAFQKFKIFKQEYNQYTSEDIKNMEFHELKAVILNGKDQTMMNSIHEKVNKMNVGELQYQWNNYAQKNQKSSKGIELIQIKNKLKDLKIETSRKLSETDNIKVEEFVYMD